MGLLIDIISAAWSSSAYPPLLVFVKSTVCFKSACPSAVFRKIGVFDYALCILTLVWCRDKIDFQTGGGRKQKNKPEPTLG